MIDELLINNGYEKRVLDNIRAKKKKRRYSRQPTSTKMSTLKLPYLSDQCTARIKMAAEKHKIPVRVVTTPGLKLKDMLTSSKPLDSPKCPNNNCETCKALKYKGKCTDTNVIYHMKCEMDNCMSSNRGHYDGETLRPTHCRFTEHFRSAKNPKAKSYVDKPWAKHYAEHHTNCKEP